MANAPINVARTVAGFRLPYGDLPANLPLLFDSNWRLLEEPTAFVREIFIERSESLHTAKAYAQALHSFLSYLSAMGTHWRAADYNAVLGWRRVLATRLAARSVNQRLAIVKSFYEWAALFRDCGQSIIPKERFANLKIREPVLLPKAIPPEALGAVLRQMTPTYALAARLAVSTGLRASELSRLALDQLPEPNDDPFNSFRVRRKGGRVTKVYVPTRILDRVHQYIDYGGRSESVDGHKRRSRSQRVHRFVFVTKAGFPIQPARFSKVFLSAKHAAGFGSSNWTFHSLRHTYGITMLRQLQLASARKIEAGGTPINVLLALRNLMGHAQLSSTEQYLRSLENDDVAISDSLSTFYDSLENALTLAN